ncbi:MAG: hypothetical protein PWR17_710 [Candidatus Methanomethylophilaceae archaeon]|nr:hypothetical protein [Candidatus Methanomethylophilaceae archaeon]
MRGSESVIDHFFTGKGLRIPVYQRNYDWKTENCKKLFDDLIELTRYDNKKHFFGSIIYQIDTHTDERIIIDGQQRLTTIAILLTALRDLIRDGSVKANEGYISDEIRNKLVHQYKGTVFLSPVKADAEAYEKLVGKGELTERSNICSNYLYFRKRIMEMPANLTADNIYRSINNLHVMIVRLSIEDGDDPQAVFESINSTGLSLTEGDRIRNYILMNTSPREQERIYEIYWSKIESELNDDITRFFRDYLIAVTTSVPKWDSIYVEFRNYANRSKSNGEYEDLLKDLVRYSRIYRMLLSADLDDAVSREASDLMHHINYIEASVAYPFIMRVMDLHIGEPDVMTTEEVVNVLRTIENMLVRRLICNVASNALNKLFPPLFRSIQAMSGNGMFSEKLKYSLLKREGTSRYPLDPEVLENLKAMNIYDRHKTCAITLALLESGNRDTADTLRRIERKELTIEHVLPQRPSDGWKECLGPEYETIREEWTHRLGNLTLTAYNSEYSNRTYKEKREAKEDGFLESELKLNQYMRDHENWGVKEMSERNDILARRFVSVVPELRTDYVQEVKSGETEHMLSADGEVFTGNLICGYVLNDVTVHCKNAKDTYLRLLTDLCDQDPERMAYIASPNRHGLPGSYIDYHDGTGWGYIGHDMYAFHSVINAMKIKILKQVIELMDIDLEDVRILVRPKGDAYVDADDEQDGVFSPDLISHVPV